jgi:sulfate adenylyltransferase
MQSLILNDRELCDLELLMNGGFAPLTGFLKMDDYHGVLDNMRLSTGELWTMPIVLSAPKEKIDGNKINLGDTIELRDQELYPLATMEIESIYEPDLNNECTKVFGTDDTNHPYSKIILSRKGQYYIGGKVTSLQNEFRHFDFREYRMTPTQTKAYFAKQNWETIVGFQTRNPMHRSHYELTKYALDKTNDPNAKLLLNPVVGITQPCDVNYSTRVKCYKKIIQHYPENQVLLSLLPLSMRMAGPREAVWHAQIRKNYGCTHFVAGRDHAGPSYKRKDGQPFFGPYDAQDLLIKHADEIGIKVITSKLIVYATPKQDQDSLVPVYGPIDELDKTKYTINNISGTDFRRLLTTNQPIPNWFSFPEIIEELRKDYPPPSQQGICLYFVGLSGAGKSTLAKCINQKLAELIHKQVTIMDGDVVRQNLSKGLGFSREDRSTNVRRIGFVASEIVKHGGIVLCANIAPYEDDRQYNRQLISSVGNYIEVYVKTSLNVCEERDVKGLYKLARAGKIKQFTGIDDPFESPKTAEFELECNNQIDLDKDTTMIINYLVDNKYI